MKLHNAAYHRLRVFNEVHRAGTVYGAARALGVTPSAVSQSLKLLEAELGLRLFQRLGKRIKATEEADRLAAVVSEFEERVVATIAGMRASRDEPRGTVRIGSASELGARVVIPAMHTLRRHAHLGFQLEFGVPEKLMGALVDHRLDLAFVDDGPFLKKYRSLAVFENVFTEELVLVCSRSFAEETVRGNHRFDALVRLPHVDYVADLSVIGLWYRHHFGRVPSTLSLKLVAESARAIVAAVHAGLGLGMVPEYIVAADLRAGRLVKISVGRSELAHAVLRAQLKDRVPTLGEKVLIEAVAREARAHAVTPLVRSRSRSRSRD